MQKITKQQIKTKQAQIDAKKELLSFDMLGRSLSFNPFFPRSLSKLNSPKRQENLNAKFFESANFDNLAPEILSSDNLDPKISNTQNSQTCIKLNSTDMLEKINQDALIYNGACEDLGFLHLYTQSIIIFQDLIVDDYQLLECLVFGADAVIFEDLPNKKDLKKLINFANRLSLASGFVANNLASLTRAIYINADFIITNNEKLINFIPKSKIVFANFQPKKPNPNIDYIIFKN